MQTKTTCPICLRKVSVTSKGYLREHKREHVWADGPTVRCNASGVSPSYLREKLKTEPLTTEARYGQIGGVLR